MNPRMIRFIILSMFSAMTGLVGIQIIWIRKAVEQREEQFNQEVFAALASISQAYEKEVWAKHIEKMLDWSSLESGVQGMMDSLHQVTLCQPKDSMPGFTTTPEGEVYLQLNWEGGYPFARAPRGPFGEAQNNPWVNLQDEGNNNYIESLDQTYRVLTESRNLIGNMLQNLVSRFVFTNQQEVDSVLLEKLVAGEFHARGIKMPIQYTVYHPYKQEMRFGNLQRRKDMEESPYRISLGSEPYPNAFELVLFFPQKNRFLLSNIIFLLIASAFLILIIIGSFAYTINVIFKQKQVQEIKNDLINNITHELKTPISTISLAVQAMSDPGMREIVSLREKYIGVIRDENHRLGQLVENVLQSAVFDRGDFRLKVKRIDLHQRIDKVLSSLSMQAQAKGIRVNRNLHAKQVNVDVDDVMMTNLFFNLVDNAIKYASKDNPFVTISTWDEAHYFCFEVADNGIGISKDDQKRIFEKLYRVPTGNVHNVKGYGLGLSYVKSIVERHHGEISVKSALGEGSRFTVKIPLKQPEQS
jgi:two-component system, OmpR family, phosphate regulon sensor histidine kinase PhoR